MPSNRSSSLTALEEKRRKLDADIEAKKQALAAAICAPFVAQFGDEFSAKDATAFAVAVKKVGPQKALERLA